MIKSDADNVVLPTQPNVGGKVSMGNKIAFACGDIFGGGTFNLINFLFIPFLTLVLGIPMVYASPLLLLTKLWDGIIDPFIGAVTDGKKPGKLGKRRYFMLIAAPVVLVALVLLFFPWSMVTTSIPLKVTLVALCYILYATAQSFVLIPYYSLASEMTDNYTERNKVNAIRLAFSIVSSLVCVAVPGMIASPSGDPYNYVLMASLFGLVFAIAIVVTALFAREQIVTPAVKRKVNLKNFLKPLKSKSYRKYLGMYMCTSMAMAVMSSFFFVYCDFVLRAESYAVVVASGGELSRFPIATVAAACMFAAQVVALPIYLRIIKRWGKRTAYIISAILWCIMAAVMIFLPGETGTTIEGTTVYSVGGVSDIGLMIIAFFLGLSVGGCVFVPHSCFGDVCDACQLQFEERTEGNISGLTNFLNTTAQAVGLALPAFIMSISALGGYVETQYVTLEEYTSYLAGSGDALTDLGADITAFAAKTYDDMVQLIPLGQSDASQLALRLVFALLPVVVIFVGMMIARIYKLSQAKQEKIVQLIEDRDNMTEEQYDNDKKDIIDSL